MNDRIRDRELRVIAGDGEQFGIISRDEALSIAESVKKGDIQGAADVLSQVLKDKPKENRWSEEELEDREISKRAFYETGG